MKNLRHGLRHAFGICCCMDRFFKKLSKEEYEAQQARKAEDYARNAPKRAVAREIRLKKETEKEAERKAEREEMKRYLNKKRQERWKATVTRHYFAKSFQASH